MKNKQILCKKCNLPIKFEKLPSGKLSPVNIDGSNHFELCGKELLSNIPFNANNPKHQKASKWIVGNNLMAEGVGIPWD